VLAPGQPPPVPSTWQWLTFSGLRAAVPASWPVTRTSQWELCGPVTTDLTAAAAVLDTDQVLLEIPCLGPSALAISPSDGLRIDAGNDNPTGSYLSGVRCFDIKGLSVCPSMAPAYGILLLRATGPGLAHPVAVSIGLAGNGAVARTILYSLRPVAS